MEITETLRADSFGQGARQKKKEDDQAINSAISASSADVGLIHFFQQGFSLASLFGENQHPKGQIILLDNPIDFSYLTDNEIVLENSSLQEYVNSTR